VSVRRWQRLDSFSDTSIRDNFISAPKEVRLHLKRLYLAKLIHEGTANIQIAPLATSNTGNTGCR
jgi:hypothetical protein